MAKILDITDKIKKNNQPDAEHVFTDDDGTKWFIYTCSYIYEDKEYCFDILASSFEDAEQKMIALKQTAKVDGKLHSVIDDV